MPWEKWALGSGDALHTDDYSRAPARPEQTTSAALHPPTGRVRWTSGS